MWRRTSGGQVREGWARFQGHQEKRKEKDGTCSSLPNVRQLQDGCPRWGAPVVSPPLPVGSVQGARASACARGDRDGSDGVGMRVRVVTQWWRRLLHTRPVFDPQRPKPRPPPNVPPPPPTPTYCPPQPGGYGGGTVLRITGIDLIAGGLGSTTTVFLGNNVCTLVRHPWRCGLWSDKLHPQIPHPPFPPRSNTTPRRTASSA